VVHIAGAVKAVRPRDYYRANAEGTANLVAAVRRAAERGRRCRFVYVSSLAAAGPSPDGRGSAAPPQDCAPVSHYGESKRRGELAVIEGLGEVRGAPWIILRPGVVYGPGVAATRLLFAQARGPVVPVPWKARPLSIIHVSDVVEAIVRAIAAEAQGHVLPLDGRERVDTTALMLAIAAAMGRRPRLVRVPLAAARGAALLADAWARLRRRAQFLSRDKLREIAAAGWVADGEPARAVLGFEAAVTLADGLRKVAVEEGLR
jgi:nucleoside-diphosphate-sugar epimerase